MNEEAREAVELDLSPFRQLVSFWRDRAEKLRQQAPESPRAEAFDMCAAQLAEALTALRAAEAASADPDALNLFPRQHPPEGRGGPG